MLFEAPCHAVRKGLTVADGASSITVDSDVVGPVAVSTLYMTEVMIPCAWCVGDLANSEADITVCHAEWSSVMGVGAAGWQPILSSRRYGGLRRKGLVFVQDV